MADLQVVAVLTAKAGSEQLVGDALTELVAPTQAEPGCLSYALFVSAVEPTVFVTVETWRSQADLDAHMQTEHIQHALSVVGDRLAQPPAIHPLKPVNA